MRLSRKKQTADPTRPTRHGHPNSFLEVDKFSTKIGEIEANFLGTVSDENCWNWGTLLISTWVISDENLWISGTLLIWAWAIFDENWWNWGTVLAQSFFWKLTYLMKINHFRRKLVIFFSILRILHDVHSWSASRGLSGSEGPATLHLATEDPKRRPSGGSSFDKSRLWGACRFSNKENAR